MTARLHRWTRLAADLWQRDAPLTAVSLLMLGAFAGALAGLWLDPRLITGAPAWLKPAKFGISTAIYSVTLAWMFGFLGAWPRLRRIAGWTTAVVFVLEIGIIDVQAWRGTTSHFNVGTPLDATLFAIMGTAILVQTVVAAGVAVALWRQPAADRALGLALATGLTITTLGALTGGLMTRPTAAQLAAVHETHVMRIAGAHTVGAPDGGPGLPGTGWSTTHGDIRVPHFVGLHAMQALPLLALWLRRRVTPVATRRRLIWIAAAGYVSLFGLLLWQALHGEPLLGPAPITAAAFAIWTLAMLVAVARTFGWRPTARTGALAVR